MRKQLKHVVVGTLAALAVAAGGPLANSAMAAEPGTPPVGPITQTPSSGTSADTFVLAPIGGNPAFPTIAFCPGNSATDGYRWQTYIAPAEVDPATLRYSDIAAPTVPAGQEAFQEATQYLYNFGGTPIQNQNTAVNPSGFLDLSGTLLSLNVFPAGFLPSGDYNIGIACSKNGITETFWEVPITLTATATGYSYVPNDGPDPVIPESPLTVLLPLTAIAGVAAVLVLRRRRTVVSVA